MAENQEGTVQFKDRFVFKLNTGMEDFSIKPIKLEQKHEKKMDGVVIHIADVLFELTD